MKQNYQSAKETAAAWGLTVRQVQYLCSQGRIAGAVRFGRAWAVPVGAEKPWDCRRGAQPSAAETCPPLPGGVPVYEAGTCDVAVIGAGHAGIEAALAAVPAGSYVGQNEPVTTLGIKTLLVASRTMDPEDVEEITENLFENANSFTPILPGGDVISLENAVEGVSIPLHRGAARYYHSKNIKVKTD